MGALNPITLLDINAGTVRLHCSLIIEPCLFIPCKSNKEDDTGWLGSRTVNQTVTSPGEEIERAHLCNQGIVDDLSGWEKCNQASL